MPWYERSGWAIALLVVMLVGVGCGGTSSPSGGVPPSPSTGQAQAASTISTPTAETSTASSSADTLTIDGSTTVLSNSFGLPGTTGYNTVVVFRVVNHDLQHAAVNVPYRVTIHGDSQVIFTSDGSDRVTILPGASQLVVFAAQPSPRGVRPESADVRFYADPSEFASEQSSGREFPDMSKIHVADVTFQCLGLVGCEALGNLTWSGDSPLSGARIMVVAHQGDDLSGPIRAAGVGSVTQEIAPGQTVPFKANVTGFYQPQFQGATALTAGPLKGEVSIEPTALAPTAGCPAYLCGYTGGKTSGEIQYERGCKQGYIKNCPSP